VRTSGYSRSTTVPSGQPNPQLDSHIGRDRAGRPYMAYKRSRCAPSGSRHGRRCGFHLLLDDAKAPDHRLAEGPPQQRQQQPHYPAGVGIDHQLQPRARRSDRRKGRPRLQYERSKPGHTVELLTGSYSVTSMLPWSWRPRSVRTSRAMVPTPIGPGEVLVMEVTAGSHLGWFWKCSVATNRNTSAGQRAAVNIPLSWGC
jgi:hypothetical protein